MSKIAGQLIQTLRVKPTVITKAFFWRIPHNSGKVDIRLKVGRYTIPKDWHDNEEPETLKPKSELTFDNEEFEALVSFLQEKYEPFKQGFKAFIPVDKPFTQDNAEQLKKLFVLPERSDLISFLTDKDIIPSDVVYGLEHVRRCKAVRDFETMLSEDRKEQNWQDWFSENSWVLGSEFVRILDERRIDTKNISDFLMEAYDGFIDIVEIKRPEGGMQFWASSKDHENYVPSTDLIKAVTQAARYIFEVERESNSVKFLNSVDEIRTVKPRGILIFGRSQDWNAEQKQAYRILNSNYHNLTIMSYDHVLNRAKRIVGYDSKQSK